MIFECIAVAVILRAVLRSSPTRTTGPTSTPTAQGDSLPLVPAKPIVALVGATNAGKSTLGNRLCGRPAFEPGVLHGTTLRLRETPYAFGYVLRDTPGLLDTASPNLLAMTHDARLVIFVATGQLLRPELDALANLLKWQGRCASTSRAGLRSTLLFCNKQDMRTGRMPDSDVAAVHTALHTQLRHLLPPENVLFGSATTADDAGVHGLRNAIARALSWDSPRPTTP